jgi:outer membrane protein OmpA-like peptidoglycan-associated protein
MLVAVGLMGLSALMGGCSQKKNELALATQEAQELREEKARLEQAIQDRDRRLAEAEAARQAALLQAQQQQVQPPQGGGWTGGGGGGGGSRPDGVFTRDDSGRNVAEVKGDVLFASGSADIRPEARRELDKIASSINRNYAGAQVRVEGHTDSDPIRKSKWGTNEALSQARADAVRRYLVQKGVSSGNVEAVGYGSSRPKGSKPASRRVEVVILN